MERQGCVGMGKHFGNRMGALERSIKSKCGRVRKSINEGDLGKAILAAKSRLEKEAGEGNSLDNLQQKRAKSSFLGEPDRFTSGVTETALEKVDGKEARLLGKTEEISIKLRLSRVWCGVVGAISAVLAGASAFAFYTAARVAEISQPGDERSTRLAALGVVGALFGAVGGGLAWGVLRRGYKRALGEIAAMELGLENAMQRLRKSVSDEIKEVERNHSAGFKGKAE